MIVLLIGDTNGGRDNFYNFAKEKGIPGIFWINNANLNDLSGVHLVVNFGGSVLNGKKTITWSGDHIETLQRIYKTLLVE